jgi:hypothetical protein
MITGPVSRCGLWVVIALLAAATCRAEETLEIIHFTPPSGWQASEKPGQAAKVYIAPDSNAAQQTLILVMLAAPADKLDLKTAFGTVAKQMTQDGKIVESGDLESTKTRQGFEAMTQTLTADVAGGQRVYARIVAANVQNRLATFCYLATSQEIYDKHQDDMDALLKSVTFNTGGGAPVAIAGAAKAEYDALERQKQDLLKKVAEIEARQRQIAGATGATGAAATGAPKSGVPISLDDPALAKAIEQFAREVDGRRKPHTILGTVLTLDGKPIPNIVTCSISVSGTTVAAERTNYTIEVDKNGHYELQVPDGLYRLSAVCHVNIYGHQVQADVMPIDGRKLYADQPSAAGIVKDFRLVLNALQPEKDPNAPESYYGGMVRLDDPTYTPAKGQILHRHPGTKVRLTFEPLCPIVDGSKIDPFVVEIDVQQSVSARIYRIPLGAYKLTAGLVSADGSVQPLSVSKDINGTGTSVEAYWERYQNSDFTRADPTVYLRD